MSVVPGVTRTANNRWRAIVEENGKRIWTSPDTHKDKADAQRQALQEAGWRRKKVDAS